MEVIMKALKKKHPAVAELEAHREKLVEQLTDAIEVKQLALKHVEEQMDAHLAKLKAGIEAIDVYADKLAGLPIDQHLATTIVDKTTQPITEPKIALVQSTYSSKRVGLTKYDAMSLWNLQEKPQARQGL
jgi:hypothetical protein